MDLDRIDRDELPNPTRLNSHGRIASIRRIFTTFLEEAPRDIPIGSIHPYLILEEAGQPDHYIQFKLFSGEPEGEDLYGEVGSREWMEPTAPNTPLPSLARGFLAAYGFTGGGKAANFSRWHLPMDAQWLAGLSEALFSVYEPPPYFGVLIKSDVPAVTAVGAEGRS